MREHSLFFLSHFFPIISKLERFTMSDRPLFFVTFYRQSVKFMLKARKCLVISKLLCTFAADLKTKTL